MTAGAVYTTQLQAGLGLVEETRDLLDLWQPGMTAQDLNKVARASGRFATVTARRLRNVIVECFAPRYLLPVGPPAAYLKRLLGGMQSTDLRPFMLLHTCRANPILGEFVREVYWGRYAAGHDDVANEDARGWLRQAMANGRTTKPWSDATVRRVGGYLAGCCADYGLLEHGRRTKRRMRDFRISAPMAAYLAHDLHFAGIADNTLLTHPDWQLFGLQRAEVLDELKRLSRQGLLIAQTAGDMVRIGWKHNSMEELCDVLAESGL